MKFHVRNLLATPAPPAESYPSQEAAQEAIRRWVERHVHNGESYLVLAGTHVVSDAGVVVWQARPVS